MSGLVANVELSGRGPNSGLLLVHLQPDVGAPLLLYASHISDQRLDDEVETGVFAGFVSMATLALTSGRTLWCSYRPGPEARVEWMSFSG